MISCEELVGRLREICEGRANLPLAKINAYRAAWGLAPLERFPSNRPTALERVEIARQAPAKSCCGGRKSRGFGDVVSNVISAVTGIQPCGTCKDRAAWLNHFFPASLPPIVPVELKSPIRHLTCHLWPVKSTGAWQWNCDHLLQHAGLFNGRRIVAIAISKETDPPEVVQEYLKGFTDEFIVVKNNDKLREVTTWVPMLERLENYQSDQDVTFSCHGKGVRHKITPDNAGSTLFRWTSAMVETLLDHDVTPLLETHAVVGSFRKASTPQNNSWGLWHYSGAFFWWRNKDVFSRNWRYVPQRFYGTEAWPGIMFRPDEAACVVGDNIGDLYKLRYWEQEIEPQLAEWRAKR